MPFYAATSGHHMRRVFATAANPPTQAKNVVGVRLSSTLAALPVPPPVPPEEPGFTGRARDSAHQRVLVRPQGLVTPTATYNGDNIRVVEV